MDIHIEEHQTSITRTWVWVAVLMAIILFKGFFAFFVVSDMGQPTWAYRAIEDVPSQSPYAEYQLLPNSQHVHGEMGE